MNFSEFKRLLGADPRSADPGFQHARQSAPEFAEAAAEAERFEQNLERAVRVPAPSALIDDILLISQQSPVSAKPRGWRPIALAASVLIAVGAAGLAWNMNRGWDSVEEYLVDHYRHDGYTMILQNGASPADVEAILAEFNMRATPALAEIVSVIKYCRTPDGKGVHMVLDTETGPVTVIYMPGTPVTDHQLLAFDNLEAIFVELKSGSAAIIGPDKGTVSGFYAMVHDSIVPYPGSS